ncbi:hypothetical protein KIH74_10725 [Kineosporia sp. J2-2]|uniref:Uncharacterized protein n=1 Tax=Kineosporia corallincola TaxID=2835133 RepID=A0ABS5TE95_9ACTN|nr:hypothetical protein [Kineosporia corallincola]MBT0769395.1 hypothetical protein [Kineosporia corallincola]
MIQPRVKLDPQTSLGQAERLREPLEDQLTSALRNAVEKVEDGYDGESVTEVEAQLREATKVGLHRDIAETYQPDGGQLRQVAATIVEND